MLMVATQKKMQTRYNWYQIIYHYFKCDFIHCDLTLGITIIPTKYI